MKIKAKIIVNQRNNDKFFKQKLHTWVNGFCTITRTVTLCECPYKVYIDDGEYGFIKVYGKNISVIRRDENEFEMDGYEIGGKHE